MNFLISGHSVIGLLAAMGFAVGLWTRYSDSPRVPAAPLENSNTTEDSTQSPALSPPTAEGELGEAGPTLSSDTARKASSTSTTLAEDLASSNGTGEAFINILPSIAVPIQRADLAVSIDGPLSELYVQEGSLVEAGELLALIDDRIAKASAEAARAAANRTAALLSATTKVTLAEQYLERIQAAAGKDAASGIEVDEAHSKLEEAKAQVQDCKESKQEAEARLAIELARLQSHEVRAPFQGVVVKVHKRLGETLGRDQVLITLVNVDTLRAEIFIPVELITRIHRDESIEIYADLPGTPALQGRITHIDPLIDAATGTIRITVEMDNRETQLPAGFAIKLRFPAT